MILACPPWRAESNEGNNVYEQIILPRREHFRMLVGASKLNLAGLRLGIRTLVRVRIEYGSDPNFFQPSPLNSDSHQTLRKLVQGNYK